MFGIKYIFRDYINTTVGWEDLIKLPIKDLPGTPYWYLYVLAIIYIFAAFLFKQRWNESTVLSISFVMCVVYTLLNMEIVFTIQYAFYYSFYFLLGCIFQIKGEVLINRYYFIQALIVILCGSGVLMNIEDLSISIIGVISIFLVTLIINLLFGFFSKYLDHLSLLSILGEKSLEIYILHIYVTSGSRPILNILHMDNYWYNVIILTFLGIVLPIAISYILKKLKLWDIFFKPVQYFAQIYDKHKNM